MWSTVLRVPITFPPDRFHGAQLSAMAAPDLLGTQGTFLLYTDAADAGGAAIQGRRHSRPAGVRGRSRRDAHQWAGEPAARRRRRRSSCR